MSQFKNFRDASRTGWGTDSNDLTVDQIKLGALLRIADATELIAKEHARLIRDRDQYKRWHDEERAAKEILERRINALKGVITKMKRRRAPASEGEQK